MRITAFLLLLALSAIHAPSALAAPGEFDPSFGQNGIAIVPTNGSGAARFVTTDGLGRVLATGNGGGLELMVRMQANGNPDTAFNGTGAIISPVEPDNLFATLSFGHQGMTLLPAANGGWLAIRAQEWFCPAPVACTTSYQPNIVGRRVNSDGSIDTTFAAAYLGRGNANSTQILADRDGGTTAVSATRNSVFGGGETTVQRITSSGIADATFNAAMAVRLGCQALPQAGGRISSGKALRLPDGKLLLAQGIVLNPNPALTGQLPTEFPYRVCVSRFNTDGTVDTSYGNNGDVLLDTLLFTSARNTPVALLPLPNGGAALILQHTRIQPSSSHFVIVWLNASGELEVTRFGGQGVTGPTSLNVAVVTAAAMQPDGKIVLAGYPESRPIDAAGGQQIDYSQPVVARLHQEGGNDLTFGFGGRGFTPLLSVVKRFIPNHLHIASDGGIFFAGAGAGAAADGAFTAGEFTQFAVGKLQGGPSPAQPAESQGSSGGGGGGCGITRNSRVDPMLPGLAMFAFLSLLARRKRMERS